MFLRGCVVFRHGRVKFRVLCYWGLITGLVCCLWMFGVLLMEVISTKDRSSFLHDIVKKGMPEDHMDQHLHLNLSSLRGYIEIHNVAISTDTKVGKHGGGLKEAMQLCHYRKNQCVGIFIDDGKAQFLALSLPRVRLRNGEGRLYLKTEFASKVAYDKDHWTCAVPLEETEATMTSSTSTGCRLPEIDPFDESVKHFFQHQSPLTCNSVAYTTFQDGILKLVDPDESVQEITYQPVYFAERSYSLGEKRSLPFNQSGVRLQQDFFKVTTNLKNGGEHEEYHAQVVAKPDVLARQRKNAGSSLNMIILGLDGTSHAQFQRHFPKSYSFLRDDLGAFIFKGFSIVGEATTPQLTAMLTGKTVEENCKVNEAKSGSPGAGTVDSWPFIFKTLKDHGYVTLYSEDSPSIGTFQLRLNNFRQQPADHYDPPFWWSNLPSGEYTNSQCLGPLPQHVVQLNYLKSIFRAYPKTPKFAFTFFTGLCHKSLNFAGVASQDILDFLMDLKKSGKLNETMLIVMGDHGARFDEIRATLQGKLEERLPFLSIVLPEWFKKQNPKMVANLLENTGRIISPLDIHATFIHLLKYPDSVSKSKLTDGRSLFEKIPKTHSCHQASIPVHFCPCLLWQEIGKTHPHVQLSAHTAVAYINEVLAKHKVTSLCYRLELQEILSVVQQMANTKVKRFSGIKDGIGLGVGEPLFDSKSVENECMYQIQVRVKPSFALFEVNVILLDGTFRVFGDISRINRYGSQPDCIRESHPYLRKFCLCRRGQ